MRGFLRAVGWQFELLLLDATIFPILIKMLKSIESKKEAEIYECLSHDGIVLIVWESFIMSDLENLGPWHKYGSSIH